MMAEPTDFEQLVQSTADALYSWEDDWCGRPDCARCGPRVKKVRALLLLVWNARGAADLVTLEAELSSMIVTTTPSGTASIPYGETLARKLRTLDR